MRLPALHQSRRCARAFFAVRSSKYPDTLVALTILILCFSFALTYLQRVGWGQFYQYEFGPAVVWACTGSFENRPGSVAFEDFAANKTKNFDCESLPPSPAERIPLKVFQYQTIYLIAAAAVIWAVAGVKWAALYPLGALLAGLFGVSVYGISRLFLRRSWAVAVTFLTTMAPLNLVMLPHLRDYAKAPFLLGIMFICGYLVKSATTPKRFYLAAALAGVVTGIGLGVRSELSMAVPFFGLVLCLVLIASRFRNCRRVVLAFVLFAVMAAGTAYPALPGYINGGTLGHVTLLGLTTPFNKPLGLSSSVYDVGDRYQDKSINDFVQEFALARTAPDIYLLDPYDATGNRFHLQTLAAYVLNFPADMVIRFCAAALQVIGLRFDDVAPPPFSGWLYRLRSILIWHNTGAALLFLFAVLVAWSRPLMGALLVLEFTFFACLGALQFSDRHLFYLEIFYWLSLIGVLAYGLRLIRRSLRNRQSFPGGAYGRAFTAVAIPAAPIVLSLLLLGSFRIIQQAHVRTLIDQYLTAPRQPVKLIEQQVGDDLLLVPIGGIIGMSGATVPMQAPDFAGYYLDATVDTARCPNFVATLSYSRDPNDYRSRTVYLLSEDSKGSTEIMFPVLKWEPIEFGIQVNPAQRACVTGLQAIAGYRDLPLPLWLQIPPDWKEGPLYQVRSGSILPFGQEPQVISNSPELILSAQGHDLTIHPFGAKAWDAIFGPTVVHGESIRIQGKPKGPFYYAATSVKYRFPKHTFIAAKGRVNHGGLAIGILNADETKWEVYLPVPEGSFFAILDVPEAGDYHVVVANNLTGWTRYNDVEIASIGLLISEPPELPGGTVK